MRHAQAAPGDPDEARPLTGEGRAEAERLGARLAGERLAAVLSSPLLRARQTAAAIAEAAGLEAEVDERLAPGADAGRLREAAGGRAGAVAVVAHQPDCAEIVLAVTGRRIAFPPGHCEELEL